MIRLLGRTRNLLEDTENQKLLELSPGGASPFDFPPCNNCQGIPSSSDGCIKEEVKIENKQINS